MKLGAQFWTVRDFCKNLDDFSETLKKIADIGYTTVHISGVCEYEPEWLAEELRKNGLTCPLTHMAPDVLKGDMSSLLKKHDIIDCKHVGLGYVNFEDGKEKEILDSIISDYKPVAKALRDGGKYFMYHNHATEFKKIDGKCILEHIADAFSPDEAGFTVDTYWVQVGGGDPAEWIEKLSGRVPCIHLKDCAYGQKISVVGEGNINFKSVFKAAEAAGCEYMFVEQDDCNGENPFDCLKRSYDNLRSYGFR